MGEKTDKAQKLANRAYAKVLGAIKDVDAIEKLACEAKDNDATIAALKVSILLRQAKIRALQADGQMDVQIKPGGMSDDEGGVTVFSGST